MKGPLGPLAVFVGMAVSVPNAFAAPAAATPETPAASPSSGPFSDDLLKLRDPFKRPQVEVKKLTPTTPLESFPVEAFKFIGVLTGPVRVRAMLTSPDGRTHLVSEQMRIGTRDGVIRKITADAIYIREKVTNILGQIENVDSTIVLQGSDRSDKRAAGAPGS